jgi:hypothetical protein
LNEREFSSLNRLLTGKCYGDFFPQIDSSIRYDGFALGLSNGFSEMAYARLLSFDIARAQNIVLTDSGVTFDAILKCDIEADLIERGYDRISQKSNTMGKCLKIRCELALAENNARLLVKGCEPYSRERGTSNVSENLVPILRKENFDREASNFLKKYCPDALEIPMPVPIRQIAKEKMGLTILEHRLSEDFSVFGEMCFSNGDAEIYDKNSDEFREIHVDSGTMLIDPETYRKRPAGCLNNTVAHECTHWEKHRFYHFILSILDGGSMVACRCPVEEKNEEDDKTWTDSDWMEFHANRIAPRILMPRETFFPKYDELIQIGQGKWNLGDPFLIEWLVSELASFYSVSRQSAAIRMKELALLGNKRRSAA